MPERSIEPVRLVAAPKSGGVRWLTFLDPLLAATYAASVAPLVPRIEATLPPHVVANRVAEVRRRPPAIFLEAWPSARARFRAFVEHLAPAAGAALVADVADCYGSIGLPALRSALERLGCPAGHVERVVGTLLRLSEHGVRGLPVGPEPSAVLANAVLLAADTALTTAGFLHLRWVDDVIVFASDTSGARAALGVLTTALGGLGLRPAPAKTRVVADLRWLGASRAAVGSGPGPRLPGPRG